MHEVKTAVKGGLVAGTLQSFESADGKIVRAGLIVSVGLPAVLGLGHTRLALAGGSHVDVPRTWVHKFNPKAGDYYVRTSADGVEPVEAELAEKDAFEALYTPYEMPAAAPSADAPQTDYLALVASPAFRAWFADRANREALDKALSEAYFASHPGTITADTGGQPSAADLDAVTDEAKVADLTGAPAAFPGNAATVEGQPVEGQPVEIAGPVAVVEAGATDAPTAEKPAE